MVQPHLPIGAFVPNPSALDRGKLPAIQETTEVESSDSDQPLNPEGYSIDTHEHYGGTRGVLKIK
uniref:Uncharacterized protein n=1 Tax=Meloidogyne enterolobii TaxID=390850 RepID=A0A6V7UHN4_MELEN|nr:unnamed protein product [Meloidogyne enterolobii]